MKKAVPKKPRPKKYEEKLTFTGSFLDMVKVSGKDAEKKVKQPFKKP